MKRIHFQIAGIIVASLLLVFATAVYAGGNPDRPVKKRAAGGKVKQKQEPGGKLAPAGPTGLPRTAPGPVDDTDVASTITAPARPDPPRPCPR